MTIEEAKEKLQKDGYCTFDTSHAVECVNGNHNRCTLLAFATSTTRKTKLDSKLI